MKHFSKLTFTLAAVLALTGTAVAQQFRFGGLMMDRDGMMSNDMYTLSQVGFGFGTARSMSMAGAFASLGGDLASMGINPAGLGMYRSNEVSLSPMMGFNNASNSAADWGENSLSRFSIGSLGAAINLYEGSGSLVSVTLGLGYNRVADFNYNYGYASESAPSSYPYRSIVDAFSRQLGQGGVFPDSSGALNYDYSDAYYWGGILAYNGFLLDVERDDLGAYWTSANRLGVNAGVGHTVSMESRGSIGEYDIAMGANIDNKLYIGATLGLQVVNWDRQLFYGEDYLYSSTPTYSDGTPLEAAAQWMDYNQAVTVEGTGINLKVGAIYRPFPSLRIGVAVHTPTYYSLERSYQSYMGTNFNPAGDTTPVLDDVAENTWDFTSPTRLMVGASYSVGTFAVLSVDYERDWYNGIRVKDTPNGFDISKQVYREEFKDNFKGSNTLRIGAEVKPLPMLALRAGYGVADGMLRNDRSLYYNRPLNYRTDCYSAGVGVAFGRTTLDLGYQHLQNKQTDYMLYYALDDTGVFDTASPVYNTSLKRNYVILTLAHRF